MVTVQHLIGPASLTSAAPHAALSVFSYNVLLPNSVDGWWTYKMYNPPLSKDARDIATWAHRRGLIQERVAAVDATIVCLQEVAPESFNDDFAFMKDLGYDGKEMFKKGRFRPATFWKSDVVTLVSPPTHKDRTLLTAFTRKDNDKNNNSSSSSEKKNWYILNCHLQAGPEAPRRLRQIHEGVRAVLTLARKLKEKDPEKNLPVVICGDFNGGEECAAVRYLEDGFVDETFVEDGAPVSSGRKELFLSQPFVDVMATPQNRQPAPPTMVVSELISLMVQGDPSGAYTKPDFTPGMVDRLEQIHKRLSSEVDEQGKPIMNIHDVENWLTVINGKVGRGSEYREAVKQMTALESDNGSDDAGQEDEDGKEDEKPTSLPVEGSLSLASFQKIYLNELRQGKFWGIAHDVALLGNALPSAGTFECRYDRMYCSAAVTPVAVMDFLCAEACPNEKEPSDHLPIAAAFALSS